MNKPLFPEVSVNGEMIPQAEIAAEAQNHQAPADKPGWAWRAAARALAIRALLLQEAGRRGLSPEPRELSPGRRETEPEALIRQLLEQEAVAGPPDEAEVRAAWERDPERFRSPALFEAAHILYPADPEDLAGRAEAKARAEAAIARIARAPREFDRIAAEESACESRANGGRLGQLQPGETLPEFEAALEGLAEGEVTAEPVATRHGFHVIRLDARAEGATLPYETVRPHLAEAMQRAAWARDARAFVERLAAQSRIEGVTLAA